MRRKLVYTGATELTYEIREIVKVAERFDRLGIEINWENIGDPIQKGVILPEWIRDIISEIAQDPKSYGYCSTKGVKATREFLAQRNNALGGTMITAEDILFCNGLGDGITKVYQYIDPGARIIGPSPAYSTHSSAEGSHASQPPLTYNLVPENHWLPDMSELRNKIRYNPNIIGILIINPDNPTGMVYPESYLREFVQLARDFDLFLLADEIYTNITYNGMRAVPLSQVIGSVPGISMKGISKEYPWPGARCGWLEFYNTDKDHQFASLVQAIENAKMLEVCSTTLPQLTIPRIMSDARYQPYRDQLNQDIAKRGEIVFETLKDLPGIIINRTYGAFYNSIIFQKGALRPGQSLLVENPQARTLVEGLVTNVPMDKRFVYYLLAATGICVVPISSFCSELLGFRITLLEQDLDKQKRTYQRLREAILEYLSSDATAGSNQEYKAAVASQ